MDFLFTTELQSRRGHVQHDVFIFCSQGCRRELMAIPAGRVKLEVREGCCAFCGTKVAA